MQIVEKQNLKASKDTAAPLEDPAKKTNASDDESSASEYEEIIEEVTDDDSEEEAEENEKEAPIVETKKAENPPDNQKCIAEKKKEPLKDKDTKEQAKECEKKESDIDADSVDAGAKSAQDSEKGESLIPLLQDLLHSNMLQAKTATQNSNSSSANKATKNNNTKTQANTKANNCENMKMLSVNNHTMTKNGKDQMTATVTSTQTTSTIPNDKTNNKSSSIQMNRLSVPQKEDSGTESGEDLRLIAAGLRDKLDMQGDTNLIDEVTTALSRLESSLREGKEIAVDGTKRKALLALVERLQTGLTSPEKLAELATAMADMETNDINMNETSSPESDLHRTSRQRFAKRRNRNSRHTVGVSREELADARRYMEDMIIMDSISSCTTPDSGLTTTTPPQWFPIEKNPSLGAITQQTQLYRPNEFVPNHIKNSTDYLTSESNSDSKRTATSNRRPLSGDYSVSFESPQDITNNHKDHSNMLNGFEEHQRSVENASPDSLLKTARFSAKRQLMKRANTIDIAKVKKLNTEFDTDSELDDKGGPAWGLKRAVQVSVKKKVRNVIPPFEPKTENDHKFLAFINKQSPKSGLGWNSSKSVSNWTNKFGNIKNTFEVGISATATTGKPPQVPGHMHQNAAKSYWSKQVSQNPDTQTDNRLQKSQQEAIERQRRLEFERLERQRIETDRLERQRQQRQRDRLEQEHFERERLEREHLERQKYEREHFERQRLERERYERERIERTQLLEKERLQREHVERERLRREREHLEIQRLENERLATAQQNTLSNKTKTQPAPVNQFIHAPQSVFRPIDNGDLRTQPIYKPIPQMGNKPNTWQPTTSVKKPITSPQYLNAKHSASTPYLASPSPTATSPIGLPWLSKPTVDNQDFKNKANMFEERSQNDERNPVYLQRHNSLRAPRLIQQQQQLQDHKKRPSLPNTVDPYMALFNKYEPQSTHTNYVPPPPTNISFTYADYKPRNDYKSVPCLLTAVNSANSPYSRLCEDSLTNPAAVPLVLTSSNPLYSPQVETNLPSRVYNDYNNSPLGSASASPGMPAMQQNDFTDDDLDSINMQEYRAESKVMSKPLSQTAVTTSRRTAHMSDDEVFGKNSRAAKSLLNTMKNINGSKPKQKSSTTRSDRSSPPKTCLSPDGRSYQAPLVDPLFPQLTNFEAKRTPVFIDPKQPLQTQTQTQSLNQKSNNYETSNTKMYSAATTAQSSRFVSENQKAYVVTYPSEESLNSSTHDSLPYSKSPPTTLPLQRNRNLSENSTTSSSISYNNLGSPNISWTANPIAETEHKPVEKPVSIRQTPQQPKPKVAKPDLAPKPQTAVQQKKLPTQTTSTSAAKPKAPQQLATTPNQQQQTVQNRTSGRNKDNGKSPGTNCQVISMRKNNIEGEGFTSLQAQNRVLSQQSLVAKQQTKQYEQQQQITEIRRKSLGNVLDVQERRSAYFEKQQEIKQEYKSSAPPDTPDIVKSSLPKDDSMPIFKKFGPPQRHLYMPNSYQNPLASTTKSTSSTSNTKKFVASTREVVNSSALPTIQKTSASPQPTEEYIPRNIVFNNVSAFSMMSCRQEQEERNVVDQQQQMPRLNRLSKSDSWNQIVQQQMQQQPTHSSSPRVFNDSPNELRRSKSGHTLTLPKMYEAGINKSDITEKQKTVAAYFSSGSKSPNNPLEQSIVESKFQQVSNKKSAINRTKTSEKVSTSRKSLTSVSMSGEAVATIGGGICRSATMPHIKLLDESNVEDAFEQLMSGA